MRRFATHTWAVIEVDAVMKNRRVIAGFFFFRTPSPPQSFSWCRAIVDNNPNPPAKPRHKVTANSCFVTVLTCPRLLWNRLWVTWE